MRVNSFLITEGKWHLGIALSTILGLGLLTSFRFSTIELSIHDTYLTVDLFSLGILLYCFTGFLVFFIREFSQGFKRVKSVRILGLYTTFCTFFSGVTFGLFWTMQLMSRSFTTYVSSGGTSNEITAILRFSQWFSFTFLFFGIPFLIFLAIRMKVLNNYEEIHV